MPNDAVLLMAYGGPRSLDEVEAYYTDIRRGSPPPPHLLEELIQRYVAIGGASPLSAIVEDQRIALEAELARRGRPIAVHAGMRHIAPWIADVTADMVRSGVDRFVALALAPQRSSNGAAYWRAVDAGIAGGGGGARALTVPSWHDEPGFIAAVAAAADDALARFPRREAVRVLFTAHSLPARVVDEGDPYPAEVAATAGLVAARLGLATYDQCFQSAGRTSEAWLGPDLRDELRRLAGEGVHEVLVCPVGFVAEHLEILYDIDIEAQATAHEVGIHLERARAMNADPGFIGALADVVERRLDDDDGAMTPGTRGARP